MSRDTVNCEALQRALFEQQRELTADEAAHLLACEECMDVLLTVSLEQKPEIAIPADFAARVAASLPPKPVKAHAPRHAGLIAAMVFVFVLLVVCFANGKPADGWIQLVFMALVATEIAGLALWLGRRRTNW